VLGWRGGECVRALGGKENEDGESGEEEEEQRVGFGCIWLTITARVEWFGSEHGSGSFDDWFGVGERGRTKRKCATVGGVICWSGEG